MKSHIYFNILAVLFLFGLNFSIAQPTTVNVQISPPADTAGACRENLFMANFIATGTHVIQIHSFLSNVSNGGSGTCGSAPFAPHIFIRLNNDSTIATVTNIVVDTANGTWTGTINTTGAVRLAYNIYIDCSVIPSPGSSQSLNLKQTWSDPGNNFNYVLNNGNDSLETTPVIFPFIADISPDFYYASYLKIINEKFMYKNTGSASVNMKFQFFPDSTQYCNQVEHLGLNYSVGINGVPNVLIPGDTFPTFLMPSDTLIITQQAKDTSCIDSTCNAVAQFYWQCGYGLNTTNVLCSHCQDNSPTDIQIRNTFNDTIKVERILPLDARYDLSCFNDTLNMMQWEYRITNSSLGALDSVFVSLNGSDSALNFLTLIPAASLEFMLNCSSCHVDSTIEMRTTALCSSYISSPLARAFYTIKGFNTTDTLIIRFKTFRCSEENNPVLLNNLKYYNQWTFPVTAKAICGNNAVRQGVVNAGSLYYGSNLGISSHANNSGADIKQDLVFTPTVTDLSVAHGMTFGDSTLMEIELKSLVQSPGFDYQLLGYNGVGANNAKDYIRATVHCDKGLRLEHPINNARINLLNSTGLYSYLNPMFFHTQVPDACVAGEYYYYFDLSASQALTYFTQGNFEFMVQACCTPDSGQTPFDVTFHLLANPDSCFSLDISDTTHTVPPICSGTGCAWLPLSSDGGEIAVHCPGCLAPGIIVDHYNMKRTSYGLQDTDNDGRADSSVVAISDTSQWYKDREQALRLRYSSFGDQLTDYMTAHFQAGDPSNGGYSYQQMLDVGVQLPFLQLSRIIPAGLDTMKLKPTAITLYIDTPVVSQPNCLECESFHVDTLQWRTQRAIHITGTNVFQYLDTLTAGNLLLFTFESRDSLGNLLGNIYDTTFVYYNNNTTPFAGFFEGQGYRLKVEYDVCGNFMPGNNDLYTLGNLSTQSAIQNKMWLSGAAHQTTNYSTIPQMINTLDSLHNAGWTLDTSDTLHTLINDTFASSFLFYCETFGGLHYFFAQDGRNLSTIDTSSGCTKVIDIKAACRTAGYSLTPLINIYPFEYRPAALDAQSYTVTVPDGYHITQARFRNEFVATGNNRTTNWRMFNAPQTNGTFILADSLLSAPVCLAQNVAIPVVSGDTSQYIGSHFTTRRIQFFIQPDSCGNNLIYPIDTTVIISFNKEVNTCISSNSCWLDSSFSRNMFVGGNAPPLGVIPALNVQVTPDSMTVNTQQVCVNVSIQNLDFTDSLGVNSSSAGFVFLALPESSQVPYFNNWAFITPIDTLFPVGGQIFQLDSSLIVGGTITGQLCASYVGCQGAALVTIKVGWNCDGFPLSPFHPDSVCEAHAYTYAFSDDSVVVSTIDKTHPGTYSLCQPFTVSAPFTSNESGNIYPQGFILNTLPQGLQVVSVVLKNCFSSAIDTLSVDSLNFNYYPISTGNLHSIGISDAALSLGECIRCEVTLMPNCEYAGQEVLPDIILDHISFCGVSDTTTANFVGGISWDGTSYCTDCFTIEKLALQETTFVGDTTSYSITICGINGSPQMVALLDHLPTGFTPISPIPSTVLVPADSCITLQIAGTYSLTGNCNDSSFVNTATIYYSQDSLASSACIGVFPTCAAQASTIVPDSSFASNYPGGFVNQTIYLDGRFYVDTNYFIFQNSTILVNAGGQIILLPGASLQVDSSLIEGCDFMWQGLYMQSNSNLGVVKHSIIRDADKAIYANNKTTLKLLNSSYEDNVRGLYVPPNISGNNISCSVYGNRFGLFGAGFKQQYSGQPIFGSVPYSGIEVNDVVMQIGAASQDSNYFFNMNTGILGFRSTLKVHNNKYKNIQPDILISPQPWNGMAVSSIGMSTLPGKLEVLPVSSNSWTMENCLTGIYTEHSKLIVYQVNMTGMRTGVASRHCFMSSSVSYCNIQASSYGIDWRLNSGATFMNASRNTITISGSKFGVGINLEELTTAGNPNYLIEENNNITIISGMAGIRARNVYNPMILKNTIYQNTNGVATPQTSGILLENDSTGTVQCNIVTSLDLNYTATYGMHVSATKGTTISCNEIDSCQIGFHFSGLSPLNLSANTMNNNFWGLEIEKASQIGVQKNKGNIWLNYRDTVGAVHWDTSLTVIQLSLFRTSGLPLSTYWPAIPPWDNGWFFYSPNTEERCGHTCDVHELVDTTRDESLEMSIAEGTYETTLENAVVADQYLYDLLARDSAMLHSQTSFEDFYLSHQTGAVGQINEVTGNIKSALQPDTVFTDSIATVESVLNSEVSSLFELDSLSQANLQIDYTIQRELISGKVDSIGGTLENLLDQRNQNAQLYLDSASLKNQNVLPVQIPQENELFINQMNFELMKFGRDTLLGYYPQILQIAQQCPAIGGPAVYRARTLVALFNDTIDYENSCLQNGSLRIQQPVKNVKTTPLIAVNPNPADSKIDIRINKELEGICKIEIANSLGSIVYSEIRNCKEKSFSIQTSFLTPGIYAVKVVVGSVTTNVVKLVIAR